MDDQNMQIIEMATEDDVCAGDHITWECSQEWYGATIFERRTGIAHHRDDYGHWCTKEGTCLTQGDGDDEYATLTIRRPVADGE